MQHPLNGPALPVRFYWKAAPAQPTAYLPRFHTRLTMAKDKTPSPFAALDVEKLLDDN